VKNGIMNSASIQACIAVFALALSSFSVDSPETAPDLVLFNGKIFTSDVAHPYVQALAIRGERIVATGDTDKIRALAGPQTKQIDLAGRTVIPGINDAHYHLALTPSNEFYLRFKSPNPSLAQAALFAEVRQAQTSDTVAAALDDAFATLELTFPREQISAMLEESLQNNDQLMVHVSGFLSASAMIDAIKSSGGKSAWAGKRVRFEHGDGLFPDLLPRVKELGVIVVQNPSHFAHNMKLARAQPLKSFLVAGIPLALGSDGGGRINPYVDIMFASTHPDRPSEAITREQAVIAYTLTSAYAEFAEKDKGSLEPGKLADLAVLSQDIFSVPTAELPKTQSVLTLVGGKAVYDAGVLH
jgi:predicted amidohydrolase YtcJ